MASRKPAKSTREALLDAARAVVDAEGAHAISMRKLATRVGISATAIYRHFEDKDALVSQLVVESFRRFGEYLSDSDKARTPLTRFRRMAQRYYDFSQERPNEYRLIFMTDGESLGFQKLDETQVKEVNGTFDMLVTRISECQQAGIFIEGDPRLLGTHAWSSFHGLASLLLTGSLGVSDEDAKSIANFHMKRLELSLLADATSVEPSAAVKIRSRPVGKKNLVSGAECAPDESKKRRKKSR